VPVCPCDRRHTAERGSFGAHPPSDLGRELAFTSGGDQLYRGQWDGWIAAYDARDRDRELPLGRLDWQSWKDWTDDDPPVKVERFRVKMVEVRPNLRRHGIATNLYKELFKQEGITVADLVPASLTPEGAAFRKGAQLREPSVRQEKIDQAIAFVESQPEPPGWSGDVAITTIPIGSLSSLRNHPHRGSYPVQLVPVAELLATQPTVDRESVIYLLQHGWDEPILVSRQHGRWVIEDGHHRAYAASLLGEQFIAAHVAPPQSSRTVSPRRARRLRRRRRSVPSVCRAWSRARRCPATPPPPR
jgi:GNAT superfamily N-acetyltransferase